MSYMKKITAFIITSLIIISIFTGTAYAKYEVSGDNVSYESSEVSDSGYVNIEPELQRISWIYYLLGGLSVAGVIAAAVIITKKKD